MNNYTEAPPTPQPRISIGVDVFRDLFGLAGSGLAGYGAWLHYQPLGYVLGGTLMVTLAVIGSIRGRG